MPTMLALAVLQQSAVCHLIKGMGVPKTAMLLDRMLCQCSGTSWLADQGPCPVATGITGIHHLSNLPAAEGACCQGCCLSN